MNHEQGEISPKTAINTEDFARSCGIEPNPEGRFIFGSQHIEPAYYYAQNLKKEGGKIRINGIASPAVTASLIHGAHPAEAYLSFQSAGQESEVKVLELVPQGEGAGPMTWNVTSNDEFTLVEFVVNGGILAKEDLPKVVPPEIPTDKPVIISGRGPIVLTQTIAAAYRHYKDMPAVAFYQPASGERPALTQIGISHNVNYPLGLSFGEPSEIGLAQEKHFAKIEKDLEMVSEVLGRSGIESEVSGTTISILLPQGEMRLEVKGTKLGREFGINALYRKDEGVAVDHHFLGRVAKEVLRSLPSDTLLSDLERWSAEDQGVLQTGTTPRPWMQIMRSLSSTEKTFVTRSLTDLDFIAPVSVKNLDEARDFLGSSKFEQRKGKRAEFLRIAFGIVDLEEIQR